MKDYFEDMEMKKNQWHCNKCGTNWLTYNQHFDCPFCKSKDIILVRIGTVAQKEGLTEWWNKP